jgi:glucosyl-3-phosphoglycerate synthase
MDFHQSGLVPTLHSLTRQNGRLLEEQLERAVRGRPAGLILPALYSEFQTPAMGRILEQLRRVRYLRRMVLMLARATESEYREVQGLFASMPCESTVVWIDGPPVQEFLGGLERHGVWPGVEGKGRSCWLAYGYLLAKGDCEVAVLQDCDILTYHRQMLARLLWPLVVPEHPFEFAKGYYPRYTACLNGRVTRLVLAPLLRALEECGVRSGLLDFIGSFRYGLAGEMGLSLALAREMEFAPDWGLEIHTLAEVHRRAPAGRTVQVDLADCYDHKHQELSPPDATRGLNRMTREIAAALFRALAAEGAPLSRDRLTLTLAQCYRRAAGEWVSRYEADARFNGLVYDRAAEEKAADVFTSAVADAAREFCEAPLAGRTLPSWRRVEHAMPGVHLRIASAFEPQPFRVYERVAGKVATMGSPMLHPRAS